MRRSLAIAFLLSLSLSSAAAPQQPTSVSATATQAATLLSQSIAALNGTGQVTDVTLTGTAERTIGGGSDSGAVTMKANAIGGSRWDLALSSGTHSEIRNMSSAIPVGSWLGTDGTSHPMAQHNLWTEAAWFFPAFSVAHGLQATSYVSTYVGQETHNSASVQHVTLQQLPIDSSAFAATLQGLSQVEIYLDSTTFLPVAIAFNAHADNNELINIPVEIRFSDYRPTNGSQVPYHVQKFLNNTLLLDIQVQSVTLNSGLPASTFNIQ